LQNKEICLVSFDTISIWNPLGIPLKINEKSVCTALDSHMKLEEFLAKSMGFWFGEPLVNFHMEIFKESFPNQ